MQIKRDMTLIGSRWQRMSISILGAILIAATLTASVFIWQYRTEPGTTPSQFNQPGARPALDQHERHAAGFPSNIYAPLDQHERHLDLFAPETEHAALPDVLDRYLAARDRSTPLDQHERHPAGLPSNIYAPLDQQSATPNYSVWHSH
jgi:hypothetical protein